MTEETEEIDTVTFEGVKYKVTDLNEKSTYVISQLTYLTRREDEIKQELDRNQMAKSAFIAVLQEELKDIEGTTNVEEE
tara:strand:+ start:65 stop:301 length:237 start_codon:yes stop_codon:yes gene_type:complete